MLTVLIRRAARVAGVMLAVLGALAGSPGLSCPNCGGYTDCNTWTSPCTDILDDDCRPLGLGQWIEGKGTKVRSDDGCGMWRIHHVEPGCTVIMGTCGNDAAKTAFPFGVCDWNQ
jgi:hypothetical protein